MQDLGKVGPRTLLWGAGGEVVGIGSRSVFLGVGSLARSGEISERDTPVKHLNVNTDTRVTWVCLK